MQHHALCLAEAGADVDLIAYAQTAPRAALLAHPRVRVRALRDFRLPLAARAPRVLFVVLACARFLLVALHLAWLLLATRRPQVVLVQSPPAIPTLTVAWLAARLRRARLVVDWHNQGHAVLAQRLGAAHPVVRILRRHERRAGRRASAHLCVSDAFGEVLERELGRPAVVLHDLPTRDFARASTAEAHALLRRLQADGRLRLPEAGAESAFTEAPTDAAAQTAARWRERRPALLVSPTSWTPDEDLGMLIDACQRWDALRAAAPGRLPRLAVAVTGLGPGRVAFEARLRETSLSSATVHTLWLSAEEYPRLLGCADLGICLHRSASGLDLPIKLADMAGSGLPVCAFDYGPCLRERLVPGRESVLFRSAGDLAARWAELLAGFPAAPALARLRGGALRAGDERWETHWRRVALPVLEGGRVA